jgi:hypothetical protein
MNKEEEYKKAISIIKDNMKKNNINIFDIIKGTPVTFINTQKEVYTSEGKARIRLADVDIDIPSDLIGYINHKGNTYCYGILRENDRTLEANDIRRIHNKNKQDNINNAINIVSKAIQSGKNFSQFSAEEKQALKVVNDNKKKV